MAFDRFNIKHLSPSSLNLWRDAPGLWTLKYLGGLRDDAGAAAWRGTAVEKGLESWFLRKDFDLALRVAKDAFESKAMGEADDATEAERKIIAPMLEMAMKAVEAIPGKYFGAQARCELRLPDLIVPVIGYLDFEFEDGSYFDLKTTKRCPSEPRADHVRAIAFYSAGKKRKGPGSLLYVTDKRSAVFPIGDNECAAALAGLHRDALALQSFLQNQESATTAIKSLPMNDADFRWSEAATVKLQEVMA